MHPPCGRQGETSLFCRLTVGLPYITLTIETVKEFKKKLRDESHSKKKPVTGFSGANRRIRPDVSGRISILILLEEDVAGVAVGFQNVADDEELGILDMLEHQAGGLGPFAADAAGSDFIMLILG